MSEEVELNIVILPDEKTKSTAIETSRKIGNEYPVEFVLNDRTTQPHITVYQARFPEKNLNQIKSNLRNVASKISPFEMTLSKFSDYWSFIFWNSLPTNEFIHLNKSVVYQLNPLRDGLLLSHLKTFRGNMSEMYSIQNYGSLLPGKDIDPHITVSRLKSEQDSKKVSKSMNPRLSKFLVDRICLGTLGPNGTVTEITDEFRFGGGGKSPYILKSENYF